ncbi:hypothetical protein MASR2M8_15200 [Opitutaceae bacterium]
MGGAPAQTLGDLGFRCELRDAQFPRDDLVGMPANESKHANLPATLGQVFDCLHEALAFLPPSNDCDDIAGLVDENFTVEIGHAFHRNDLAMAKNIDGDISRGGEKKGFDEADWSPAVCVDQSIVAFLDDVVHVAK